jgi:hypothetical protein
MPWFSTFEIVSDFVLRISSLSRYSKYDYSGYVPALYQKAAEPYIGLWSNMLPAHVANAAHDDSNPAE